MNIERSQNRHDERAAEKIHPRPGVASPVDVFENAEELLVVADLPGVTEGDLSIRVEKGELTFEGRRTDAAEIGVSAEGLPDYRRSFLVPQGIDAEKIVAVLQAGVLRVHLPKSAALKPRQIPIRTS
jgi:HSP20 family protein